MNNPPAQHIPFKLKLLMTLLHSLEVPLFLIKRFR